MPDEKRYIALDGIRGICALTVMLFHFTNTQRDFLLFGNAPISVDLFFMLSGFVLCASYRDRILNGRIDFVDFMSRRIIRLYPMMALGLVAGAVGLLLLARAGRSSYSIHDIVTSTVYNLLYIPYLNNGYVSLFGRNSQSVGSPFPANGVNWSLWFEVFINLFFFVFLSFKIKTLKRIVILFAVAMVFSGVLSAWSHYYFGLEAEAGFSTNNFFGGFLRVGYGFVMGILVFRCLEAKPGSVPMPPWVQPAIGLMTKHAIVLYLLLIGLLLIPQRLNGFTFGISVLAFCPLVLIVGAQAEVSNGALRRASEFLGWISYPLYCLHPSVWTFLSYLHNRFPRFTLLPFPFWLEASLVSIAVSAVLTKIFEEPVRRFLTARWKAYSGLRGPLQPRDPLVPFQGPARPL